MSRTFSASGYSYGRASGTPLSNSAGPFTIAWYAKPINLTQNTKCFESGDASGRWYIRCNTGTVTFYASVFTGTDPGTDSEIALDSDAVDNGTWLAYRYVGAGAEWSKWRDGSKTVINAAVTFTIGGLTGGSCFVGAGSAGGSNFDGDLAEIAIWDGVALSDGEMAELANGVAADQIAYGHLQKYWFLRGNNSPEPEYSAANTALTLVNSPVKGTHPVIVPPRLADRAEPVWIVDVLHGSGTVSVASTDLWQDVDYDILGTRYDSKLAADLRLIEELPDTLSGVQIPANTVISIRNEEAIVDKTWEWRQVPVRVRYYDRVSHALTTEFSGVVADRNISRRLAVFTCQSHDYAVLNQLVPRQVIEPANGTAGVIDDEDANTVRTDVGAPIPVVFGEGGQLSPPYIGYVQGTQTDYVGAGDHLLAWGTTAICYKVYYDQDSWSPGLELASRWSPAAGTALTYLSTTSFTATGVRLEYSYFDGMPLRHSDDGGTTWDYSYVTSTNINADTGGTVTVNDAIISNPFGTAEIASEYIIENNRYSFVGAGGTTALLTMRFLSDPSEAIICTMKDTTRTNPATCISFLLNDADVGLGQSVNTTAFTTAATSLSTAGLGSAVASVLGGQRQQRRAIDVINEIAMMRGIRVWYDADNSNWTVAVDGEPAASAQTFSFGQDEENNIQSVDAITTTPLADAVSELTLVYDMGGRTHGSQPLQQQTYATRLKTTVLGIGGERVIESPWLRSDNSNDSARRVCYYLGKVLKHGDEQITFTVGHDGRRTRLGDLVTLVISDEGSGISGDYRIRRRERTLTQFKFLAVGYDSEIYTYDTADVSSPESTNPDERARVNGQPTNLVLNADFSSKLKKATIPNSSLDGASLPHWAIYCGGYGSTPAFSSLTYTTDASAMGGGYLTLTTTSDCTTAPAQDCFLGTGTGSGFLVGGISVEPGRVYVASVYLQQTGQDMVDGVQMQMWWKDTVGSDLSTSSPVIRVSAGDISGLGFKRYYIFSGAPPDAGYVVLLIRFQKASAVYKVDAVQVEELTRAFVRPTPWRRNPLYGILPNDLLGGDMTVRVADEPEHGVATTNTKGDSWVAGVALSGASVDLGELPVGLITGITARVMGNITFAGGGSTWGLGITGTPNLFMSGIASVTAGNTVGDANMNLASWRNKSTGVQLIATPDTGTFDGGNLKVTIHAVQHVAPTS